ncbi:site-specific DNA-methyltransferase [Pseudonocardia sp. ICBG1122]|nr:site-specific DNA-methyltransferase [Pseudonocardia pini]
MGDEGSILDQAIGQIQDEALRARIAREVDLLRGSRRFGLVFDRHLPEAVRLPDHPVRKGVTVTLRDESTSDNWRVLRFTDSTRSVAVLDGDGGQVPTDRLVVLREFGEPVYPGLRSVERIERGPADAPWHVVINGENFHVLQALRATRRGKVDLIYIDPPYNTGNDGWIYNDRYVDTNDRAKSSKWLSFMERRLLLARDLLKPTGVIIVAIGDEEHHRLRMLLDQVFGAANFLSDIVWQGGRKNDSRYVSNAADYMLAYARDETVLASDGVRWREKKPGVAEALAAAAEIWKSNGGDHAKATTEWRAWIRKFKSSGLSSDAVTRFATLDAEGRPIRTDADLRSPNPRPNLQYELLHPRTGKPVRMHPNGWRYSRETMTEMLARGLIYFGPDHTTGAGGVSYLEAMDSQVPESVFIRDRNPTGRYLQDILGDRRFPNPKDPEVLSRWMRLAAPPDAVILDFFGGSGTTTDTVLRLNNEDGGTRQSILVTNNEVGARQATALRKDGQHPGDPEWETLGVFEHVTRPRISTIVTGERPDGFRYSDGLKANVEMFDVTYLDPGTVRRGREFSAIAPLMWIEGGARGGRISDEPEAGWALTPFYGVLTTIDALASFADAVASAAVQDQAPAVVFIVTDSPTEYQHAVERLPVGVETVQLYQDYLANYTINVERSTR